VTCQCEERGVPQVWTRSAALILGHSGEPLSIPPHLENGSPTKVRLSGRVVDFEAEFVDLQLAAAATVILNSARDIP